MRARHDSGSGLGLGQLDYQDEGVRVENRHCQLVGMNYGYKRKNARPACSDDADLPKMQPAAVDGLGKVAAKVVVYGDDSPDSAHMPADV